MKGDRKIEEIKKNLYESREEVDRNNLFKPEEEYYKPIRTGNAFSGNYIEYKSNGNKDKILSTEYYHDKTEPYLIYLIENHKT